MSTALQSLLWHSVEVMISSRIPRWYIGVKEVRYDFPGGCLGLSAITNSRIMPFSRGI